METDDHSSDDEVFFGEIRERERSCLSFNSRRRTTLYFPGVSRPDASVNVFHEVTDDGTFIFSCEEMEHTEGKQCVTIDNRVNDLPEDRIRGHEARGVNHLLMKSPIPSLTSSSTCSVDDNLLTGSVSEKTGASDSLDNDSGFGSVGDGTLIRSRNSSSSSSWVPSTTHESESMKEKYIIDDRKRKHCEMSSPDSHAAQFLSPFVSNCTPTRQSQFFANTKDSKTRSSAVSKRHIACVVTPTSVAPTSSNSSMCDLPQNNGYQVHAFSQTKLKSKVDDVLEKHGVSPVLKEFPNINISRNCMDLTNSTSPNVEGFSPLSRKTTSRKRVSSTPHEPKKNLPDKIQAEMCENVFDMAVPVSTASAEITQPITVNEIKTVASGMTAGNQYSTQHIDFGSEICQNSISPPPMSSSVHGAEVDDELLYKDPAVFVPETPNIKTSLAPSAHLKERSVTAPLYHDHGEESEDACVPSSQKTDTEVLHEGVNGTTLMTTPQSSSLSKNTRLQRFLEDKSFSSPDLFSSPSFSRMVSQTEATGSSDISGYSTNPAKSASSTFLPMEGDILEVGSTELSDSITEQLRKLSPVSGSLKVQQNGTGKKPKYPPLRRLTSNKENMSSELTSNLIFPSPLVTSNRRSTAVHGVFDSSAAVTPAGLGCVYTGSTEAQLEVEESSRAAMTRINTMINSEIRHSMLDPQSSPALLIEFPPPKEATKVSWSEVLFETPGEVLAPVKSAAVPRSILQQRPDHSEFPFSKDPPSPIVLTRKRAPRWPRLFSLGN